MATILSIVGAAAQVGTQVYGASQKKDAAGAAAGQNYGQKPKAAEYKPVDFSAEQIASTLDNLKSLGKGGGDLMRTTNAYLDTDALMRAHRTIPGYKANLKQLGMNTGALLRGQLPYSDVLDIVANRGGLEGSLGTPGGGATATYRDLGLSQLEGMKTGAGLLGSMVNIAETINPISRRARVQDQFLSPLDRIRLGMEQNQLIQQSDQSKYNIEAGISPSELAARQIQLSQIGSAGSEASAVGSGIGSILGSVSAPGAFGGDSAGGASGHYGATFEGYSSGMPVYRPQVVSYPKASYSIAA